MGSSSIVPPERSSWNNFLFVYKSIGKKPLEYWTKEQSQTGKIRKTVDSDLLENVVEIQDLQKSNSPNTSITCPARAWQLLNIPLAFLVIVIKNMSIQCCLKVQVVDANDVRHHFHFSNEPFENDSSIRGPVISRVGLSLEPGWNRVELDLVDLARRVFNTEYKATQRISICANCRVRRVYLVDRHYNDTEMSAGLCGAFLDHYMIKRGISRASGSSKFLKTIQAKSSQLINNYFIRTSTNNHKDAVDCDLKAKMRLMIAVSKLGDLPEETSPTECNRKSRSGDVRRVTPDGNGISVKPKRDKSRYKNRKVSHSGERDFPTIPKPVEGQSTLGIKTLDQTLVNNPKENRTEKCDKKTDINISIDTRAERLND